MQIGCRCQGWRSGGGGARLRRLQIALSHLFRMDGLRNGELDNAATSVRPGQGIRKNLSPMAGRSSPAILDGRPHRPHQITLQGHVQRRNRRLLALHRLPRRRKPR